MGLPQQVKELADLRQDFVIETQPAFYAAATFDMFTVTGGPVIIKLLVEYLDTAMTNVTTTTWNFETIAMDAGAVAINAGAIGSIVLLPLMNAAKAASALGAPYPDVIAVAANGGWGFICGLGNLDCTFATPMAAADRYSAHLVYQKLGVNSLITPQF